MPRRCRAWRRPRRFSNTVKVSSLAIWLAGLLAPELQLSMPKLQGFIFRRSYGDEMSRSQKGSASVKPFTAPLVVRTSGLPRWQWAGHHRAGRAKRRRRAIGRGGEACELERFRPHQSRAASARGDRSHHLARGGLKHQSLRDQEHVGGKSFQPLAAHPRREQVLEAEPDQHEERQGNGTAEPVRFLRDVANLGSAPAVLAEECEPRIELKGRAAHEPCAHFLAEANGLWREIV